jgi:hypothetical protein
LEVVALGKNKSLYHRYQQAGGGWSEWATLGVGPFAEPMTLTRNADGRLEVFVHNAWKQIVHAWQLTPNGPWKGEFQHLDVIPANTGAHAVTMMPDGRLVLAAVGNGGTYPGLRVAGQIVPNGEWEAWGSPPTEPPPAPPKPIVKDFTASPNNGYAPIGTKFNFAWNVLNCGTGCTVSLTGKTGLGNYNTVFFHAYGFGAQGQVDAKPDDTNTLFTLLVQGSNGNATESIEVKLTGTPAPNPCAGCKPFYFKIVPPTKAQACTKKGYLAVDEDTAKKAAESEYPGWTATKISESQFTAVGC